MTRVEKADMLLDDCGGGVIPHNKIAAAIEAAMNWEREQCSQELEHAAAVIYQPENIKEVLRVEAALLRRKITCQS